MVEHNGRVERVVEIPSRIAGLGTFSTVTARTGQPILHRDVPADLVNAGRVNHSCDPSLWWDDDGVTLVARRDVGGGEELTVDYATCTDDPDLMLRCNCRSLRCRGMIEGDDWAIPQLQQRYSGHFALHLQERMA